jgi:CRP-like cAMP-binding protein
VASNISVSPIALHLQKINAFVEGLEGDVLAALHGISTVKTYQKGAFLLKQGERGRCSYWIEKGIVKKFYLTDGKEVVTELLFENDMAVSLGSYLQAVPSEEYIQAVTEVTASCTDHDAFQSAKEAFPALHALDLLMTEYHALWLEKRLFDFHTMDATARYQALIRDQPHVVQRVPLTYIASYLGVSLETLSRIRAKP